MTSLDYDSSAQYYSGSFPATTSVVLVETCTPLALLPMKFSERVRVARKAAGLTQEKLARLVTRDPEARNSLIDRIENRPEQEASDYTAQIAHHCRVSAMWLATGEGEMWLDRSTISETAALIGMAWDYLKPPVRDVTALDVLDAALGVIPPKHAARRLLERLQRDTRAKRQIHLDLSGNRPPAFSRAGKPEKVKS